MAQRPRVALVIAVIIMLITVGHALAAEQPRYGGVLTWLEYADPGRLDFHTESPLSVLQAISGIYKGTVHPTDPTRGVRSRHREGVHRGGAQPDL
jgi:hypothetical protein